MARLQRGRIAFRQLREIGVPPASVTWLISRGRLFPSLRCVFCVGHDARTDLARETDALLSVRDGAALSHWSAAALWGLWTPMPTEVDVMVSSSSAARNTGVKVHRSRTLESGDVWLRKGLPVTSPARTLLDIAVTATARQLEIAFDRGLVEKTLRPSHVRDVLDRAGGHRGRAQLAALLNRERGGTTVTASPPEERMLTLIRRSGLPDPDVNFPFAGYRLDFYWPDARFVLEVDSRRFHSTPYRLQRDRTKDDVLRRADIEVMRVMDSEIEERSHSIVVDITRALARRGGL